MKKIIALALSAVMVAAFAGCGSKSTESSKGKEASAAPATKAQETQATQETFAADVKARLDDIEHGENFSGVMQINQGRRAVYRISCCSKR